ncbi:MAG: hypothetical protein E6R03_18165 [Hyphomicrobiaceae bacterium]|nr:MAG: hypothetical protein E6R03_18165 [Hyphomicrobiaceae bacterium]
MPVISVRLVGGPLDGATYSADEANVKSLILLGPRRKWATGQMVPTCVCWACNFTFLEYFDRVGDVVAARKKYPDGDKNTTMYLIHSKCDGVRVFYEAKLALDGQVLKKGTEDA